MNRQIEQDRHVRASSRNIRMEHPIIHHTHPLGLLYPLGSPEVNGDIGIQTDSGGRLIGHAVSRPDDQHGDLSPCHRPIGAELGRLCLATCDIAFSSQSANTIVGGMSRWNVIEDLERGHDTASKKSQYREHSNLLVHGSYSNTSFRACQ